MRNILCAALFLIGFSACKETVKPLSESEKTLAKIDSLEAGLFTDSEAKADVRQGMALVRAYAKYYQNSAKDSLAIEMLFKAGEVSMGIGQGNLAVKYFETITKDHSDFSKAPEAMFLCGFCSETLMADTAKAKLYYEKFIEAYPNHKLAEDAQFSIQNMGMSDEDLIKLFQEKAKLES